MTAETKKEAFFKYLINLVTPSRMATYQKVLSMRTRYLTVVLEDIFQPHNASAVLRTCDCFGVQDVHIIENRNEYTLNPDVALGSSKWLNLHKYNTKSNNSPEAIALLRQKGYRIVATTPHRNDIDLENFDPTKGKIALFFGTEKEGLSDYLLNEADEFLKIPMYGFTESFNISVSAAVILHHLNQELRNSDIDWQLTDTEKSDILYRWVYENIKRVDLHEKKFFEQYI